MAYTLGTVLYNYRKQEKLSLRELAKDLKISYAYLGRLEKGVGQNSKKPISPSYTVCKNIATRLNMSLEEILIMAGYEQGESSWNPDTETNTTIYYKPIKIPVLGRIPAGVPIEAVEEIVGWEELSSRQFSTNKDYFALLVVGDSMSPKYLDGDIVIIQQSDDAESGKDVVAIVNGNDATLKRLIKYENGAIALQPLNSNYTPLIFSKDDVEIIPVKVCGFVVEIRRKV